MPASRDLSSEPADTTGKDIVPTAVPQPCLAGLIGPGTELYSPGWFRPGLCIVSKHQVKSQRIKTFHP